MSAGTAAPPDIAPSAIELYRYSTWVHVGPGAENCEAVNEDNGTNDCSDRRHFHAWCRLPNQFVYRDLRDRATAAKSRKARQYRNEGSDLYEIMEGDLDELLAKGEDGKREIVNELLAKDFWTDYAQAAGDVREEEGDSEDDKPFEHVLRDQERWTELDAKAPDERPAEEYEELTAHLAKYGERVKERLEELTAPKRTALEARDVLELRDELRNQRIDIAANEEFMSVYSMHEWVAGTFRQPGGDPVFASTDVLQSIAPEVYDALEETFQSLEASERGSSGNS